MCVWLTRGKWFFVVGRLVVRQYIVHFDTDQLGVWSSRCLVVVRFRWPILTVEDRRLSFYRGDECRFKMLMSHQTDRQTPSPHTPNDLVQRTSSLLTCKKYAYISYELVLV